MPRIQISEPGKTPQPYKVKLDREEIKIGRAANNDIRLTDPSTSSAHCIIRRVEGGFVLEDNNSTNGVKLDEQRFTKIDLNQDLEFQLGDVDVDFSFLDEEFDILAEEDSFVSKQQPMLPPSKQERDAKRKSSAKEKARKDDDIVLETEDDEEELLEEVSEEKEEKPAKRSSRRSSDEDDFEQEEEKPTKGRNRRSSEEDDTSSKSETEKPAKKLNTPAPRRAQRIAAKNKSNALVSILFIVLCILGFVVGLSIKHYQENKTFLIKDIIDARK